MNEITKVEFQNQLVLTTKQLAEFYETTEDAIRQNYSRNAERYQDGIHYFQLRGDELKEFKGIVTNCHDVKNHRILTLWTEKGAFNHAKSLGSDKAWDVYNMLVDTYYRVKESTAPSIDLSKLSPDLQMFHKIFQSVAETQLRAQQLEDRTVAVETKIGDIKDALLPKQEPWRDWANRQLNKVAESVGPSEYQNMRPGILPGT